MKPHHWFRFWILLGVGLGIVLLIRSISNYSWLSHRVLIEQLRRDLAAQVAGLDRRMASAQNLDLLLDQTRQSSSVRLAWIYLRDADGNLLARAGLAGEPAFPTEFVRTQFRSRQPVFKTVESDTGRVLVEEFPLRLPARRLGFVEMAAFLDGAGTTFWPLRRNLLIRLNDGGPVLGLLPTARFEQGAVPFEPGDVLVLYSDGLVEAANGPGEEFGADRLAAVVGRCLDKTADQIRDHILESVGAFTGQAPLSDDRTLLVIRHREVAELAQAA
jgi:hypothetical protein